MHQDILNKIKGKFFMLMSGALLIIFSSLILLFFVSDKTICLCISLIGVFLIYVAFSKYGNKTEENTYILVAECVSRSKSGYRRQYFNYYFKTEDGKSFEIKTAQKERFKSNLRYVLCFKKHANEEKEDLMINTTDLIFFELT